MLRCIIGELFGDESDLPVYVYVVFYAAFGLGVRILWARASLLPYLMAARIELGPLLKGFMVASRWRRLAKKVISPAQRQEGGEQVPSPVSTRGEPQPQSVGEVGESEDVTRHQGVVGDDSVVPVGLGLPSVKFDKWPPVDFEEPARLETVRRQRRMVTAAGSRVRDGSRARDWGPSLSVWVSAALR